MSINEPRSKEDLSKSKKAVNYAIFKVKKVRKDRNSHENRNSGFFS